MAFINLLDLSVEYKEILLDRSKKSKGDIIYIHGFGGNIDRMDYLSQNITNYNFYGLNFPFHGKTSFHSVDQINVFYYANLINKFIEVKNLKDVIIIGHSMGGAVGPIAYFEQPKSFKKLILVGPLNKTSANVKDIFVSGFFPNTLKERLDFMDKVYYCSKEKKQDANLIKDSLNYVNLLKNNQLFSQTLKRLGSQLISENLLSKVEISLRKIKIPTLLIYGEADNIIDLKNIASYYKKNVKPLTFYIVPKSGHTPWDENPKDFFEVVKGFIES